MPSSIRIVVVAVALGAGTATAAAQTPDFQRSFYQGARAVNGTYVGLGLLGMGAGGALITSSDDVARGSGIVMASVGAIHLVTAIALLATQRRAEARLMEQDDPLNFERSRIAELQRRFHIYHLSELSAAAIGAGLVGAGITSDRKLVVGIGLGLFAQAIITWLMDLGAAANADRYAHRLETN